MVSKLLEELEREWYGQSDDVPDLKDLFDAAVRTRDRHGFRGQVCLHELVGLVYEVLERCLKAYDPRRQGEFRALFQAALLNRIRHHLGLTRAGARRRRRLRDYAYVTRDRHIDLADPLAEWVDDAVAELPLDDEWLIRQLYWREDTIRSIARRTGIDKSKLSREHGRILKALKARFITEMWGLTRAA
jgi:hypothetical protein